MLQRILYLGLTMVIFSGGSLIHSTDESSEHNNNPQNFPGYLNQPFLARLLCEFNEYLILAETEVFKNRLVVINKDKVSSSLRNAQIALGDFLKSEGIAVEGCLQERHDAVVRLFGKESISFWGVQPEFTPSDNFFELLPRRVEALRALYSYIKNSNLEHLKQELSDSHSILATLNRNYRGIESTLCLYTFFNKKCCQNSVDKFSMLNIVLERIAKALEAGQIEVSDKTVVVACLIKVR